MKTGYKEAVSSTLKMQLLKNIYYTFPPEKEITLYLWKIQFAIPHTPSLHLSREGLKQSHSLCNVRIERMR